MFAAATIISMAACPGYAQFLTIDGRDEANLASEGNFGTFHNPPVNFAFIYGDVAATNLQPNPPGPSSPDFHYVSTGAAGGGGIGFGTNQIAFPAALAYAAIDVTVNPNNTLDHLTLILKDVDPPTFAAEDLQYNIPLGAPGTKTLIRALINPSFVFNAKDSIPNFDPGGLGMSELQLQFPFGLSPAQNMDLTIHSVRLFVPEPSTLVLLGFSGVALCGVARRRVASA